MDTQKLVDAVNLILPAVDAKGLVQEFSCLHFGNGFVEATNGTLSMRVSLGDATLPEFSVNGQLLASLLSTIKEKEIMLSVEEKQLVVKTSKIVGKLLLAQGKPLTLDFAHTSWESIPTDFIKGLRLCRFTACTDQVAGTLTGVYVDPAFAISCDRFRISKFVFGTALSKKEPFVIPVSIIDFITKRSALIKEYCVVDGTISFLFEDAKAVVAAKLLQGDYSLAGLLSVFTSMQDKENEGKAIVLSTETRDQIGLAVERQNLIQSSLFEFDRETLFEYDKGQIKLYSVSENVGSIEELVTVVSKEKQEACAFSFYINPIFLLEALAETDTLWYSKELAIVRFRSDKFIHVVKPKQTK